VDIKLFRGFMAPLPAPLTALANKHALAIAKRSVFGGPKGIQTLEAPLTAMVCETAQQVRLPVTLRDAGELSVGLVDKLQGFGDKIEKFEGALMFAPNMAALRIALNVSKDALLMLALTRATGHVFLDIQASGLQMTCAETVSAIIAKLLH